MFGNTKVKKQDETTNFNLRVLCFSKSIYFIYTYKKVHNLKIYGAIFYNHESPKPDEYNAQKIVKHICEIYNGKRKYLELGYFSKNRLRVC